MTGLRLTITLLCLIFSAACSPKLVPIATSTSTIDPQTNAIVETRNGITLTVKLDAMTVSPYQLVDNISSFHVVIDNQNDTPTSIPLEAFVLRDATGQQYRTISPEMVSEIISRDSVYLIPYPYVGYYYLQDQARQEYVDTTSSALPFYAEYHPQELYTRALPEGPILPHARIRGVIYFIVDMSTTTGVELQLYADESIQGEPIYRFPFAVE